MSALQHTQIERKLQSRDALFSSGMTTEEEPWTQVIPEAQQVFSQE